MTIAQNYTTLTKFNQYILGLVLCNLIKVLSDKDLDWVLVPILWYILAHQVGRNLHNTEHLINTTHRQQTAHTLG